MSTYIRDKIFDCYVCFLFSVSNSCEGDQYIAPLRRSSNDSWEDLNTNKVVKIDEKLWYPGQPNGQELQECTTYLGTIHILRKHIPRIFGPPLRYVYCIFLLSTENKQKLAFPDPLPSTSAYVIYEWFHSERRPSI